MKDFLRLIEDNHDNADEEVLQIRYERYLVKVA